MINAIWVIMLLAGFGLAAVTGDLDGATNALFDGALYAVELCIGLTGIYCLWLGILNIAEESGLVAAISKKLGKLLSSLFPGIPQNHGAMGAITMNIIANMLGLGNAATPLGIRAMEEMQKLNNDKDTATDAMCMFLVINTSSVQLIPATVVALRAAAGSDNPTEIIGTALIATTCSTIVGILAAVLLRRRNRYKHTSLTKSNVR